MRRIFATGATGYVGGDALSVLADAHPDYEITCLVRNSDKGAKIAAQYPKIRLVYGDLDSSDILIAEAAKADVVCHWADADHAGAATSLLTGLSLHPPERPGFLIHTSGTGILVYKDLARGTFGVAETKNYNDWDGVSEVTSIPDEASHRNVDKIVLAGHEMGEQVKTAIVCPPTIYGIGRGPENTSSMQTPELSRVTLQTGHGVQIEEGKNMWSEVHVHDLSNIYLRLVEEAAKGGGSATWGPSGYYFTENGQFTWGKVASEIAKVAKSRGWTKSDEVKVLTVEEANKLSPYAGYMWGTNSKSVAERARHVLGWKPVAASLMQEIPKILEVEARKLGMVPGHAAEAAG